MEREQALNFLKGFKKEPVEDSPEAFLSKYKESPAQLEPGQLSQEQDRAAVPKPAEEIMAEPRKPRKKFNPYVLTEGIKKGFSDFASLPGYAVDVVNLPLHALGITPEEAVGSSTQLRRSWQAILDYTPQTPQSGVERYLGKIGEFAGGSVVPSMGITSKVISKGAPLVSTDPVKVMMKYGMRGKQKWKPITLQPATNKELASVVGLEAASVVTGGVGSEFSGKLAEEAFGEEARPVGELIGGISGGMSPYYFKSAGGLIYNGSKAAKTVATDEINTIIENTAKQQIAKMAGDDPVAARNIQRAMELQKEIPGFDPSLAAATGSKGVIAEQHLLDGKTVENYNEAISRIRKGQEAIDQYYKTNFGTERAKILSYKQTGRAVSQDLKTQAGQVDEEISRLADSYKRQPTKEIGERLRELRAIKQGKVRPDVRKAYDELYKAADDQGIVDDANDLYELARNFKIDDDTVFQNMPGVYKKMVSIFGREVDPDIDIKDQKIMTSFRKLHSLMKEVSSEYGKALKSGDSAKQYYLGQVNDLLDMKLSQFDDPIYGTFAAHKKAVDDFWLTEYHNVFKKGVGGKMVHETRWGETTPDQKIVSDLVLTPGSSEGLDQFNKIYQDMPEAQILLRQGILDEFASRTISKGKLTSGDVRKFLNTYREVMDKLPDLRNAFLDTDATINALVNRKEKVLAKSRHFAERSISPYARAAGFPSSDAAIDAGLKDQKVMDIIVKNAKSPKEQKDISALIADNILEKPDPWGYILENEQKLAKHFNRLGPGHFQRIKNIAEAQSVIKRYSPKEPAITRVVEDKFYKKFGTTFSSAVAQMRWALYYNKTGAYYPVVDMGSKYFYKIREDKLEDLMKRALYDKDLSKTLDDLSKIKDINIEGLKTRELFSELGTFAINNGIRASSVAAGEEE